MTWDIRAYDGVGRLRFGIDFATVKSVLGDNGKIIQEGESFRYIPKSNQPITIFDNDILCEISFSGDHLHGLTIEGANLSPMTEEEILTLFSKLNGGPVYECYGFLLFSKIGLSLSGFHDGDESQKTITAFRKGHWDEFRDAMNEFSV